MTYSSLRDLSIWLLGLSLLYIGCSFRTEGVLKNETGDTVHLSITGLRAHLYTEYWGLDMCDCPKTIDSLGRTAMISLPPDSAIEIGFTGAGPRDYHKPNRADEGWRTYLYTGFDSVNIVGPRYIGAFNDSTITTLPLEQVGSRYIFKLVANR